MTYRYVCGRIETIPPLLFLRITIPVCLEDRQGPTKAKDNIYGFAEFRRVLSENFCNSAITGGGVPFNSECLLAGLYPGPLRELTGKGHQEQEEKKGRKREGREEKGVERGRKEGTRCHTGTCFSHFQPLQWHNNPYGNVGEQS